MARINDNYLRLKSGYLFSEIARRVKEFQGAHPDAKLIRLGIGDATQPLPPAIVAALHAAVDEMARDATCRALSPAAAGRSAPPPTPGPPRSRRPATSRH